MSDLIFTIQLNDWTTNFSLIADNGIPKNDATNKTDSNISFISCLGSNIKKTTSKTTKMMAIITGTYYGLYLPSIVNYLVNYDLRVKRYLFLFINALFYCNAILNPIMYAWMNKDFRNAFRKILRIRSPPDDNNSVVTGTSFALSMQSM